MDIIKKYLKPEYELISTCTIKSNLIAITVLNLINGRLEDVEIDWEDYGRMRKYFNIGGSNVKKNI